MHLQNCTARLHIYVLELPFLFLQKPLFQCLAVCVCASIAFCVISVRVFVCLSLCLGQMFSNHSFSFIVRPSNHKLNRLNFFLILFGVEQEIRARDGRGSMAPTKTVGLKVGWPVGQ